MGFDHEFGSESNEPIKSKMAAAGRAKQKGGKSRDTTKGIPAKYRKQIYMEYLKKTENEG